ncbi:universal stress protein [Streptomyces sp. NPDC057690]|uniref:universal stress protein n=1 Tax=Streptomyces sp. NPDC057690 TaxID=3346214 RepID=UPI0036C4E989
MRTGPGSPPDPSRAEVIVCGVRADGRPLDSRLPAAVRAADCPLVLVPDGAASPHLRGTVLVGADARSPCGDTLDFAFDSARMRGALLHVVHAWSLPSCAAEWPFAIPERERATWEDHEVQLPADVLRPWRRKYPHVPVYEDVVLLAPARALMHHAQSASLIVVGTSPGTGWGEVVRALLPETVCPVAVVPARSTS